jgi:hypothetical protein
MKKKITNYTVDDIAINILKSLDYLITDHPDPKDGTCHKIHLPLCAEIIQCQLKEIYRMVQELMEIKTIQYTFA